MPFGKKASQYEKERGDENEVWIKGFRDGETRVRFLMVPDDMITYREHYAEAPIGYFPCSEEKDCVGCQDDSQQVRQRTRRFATLALNDRGQQQVYKVGSRVHRSLKSKEQRLQTTGGGSITDRDYVVVRSGKNFNDISYDIEPGEKYAVEFTEEPYDIGQILEQAYAKAVKAYAGDTSSAPVENPKAEPPARRSPVQSSEEIDELARKEAEAAKAAAAKEEPGKADGNNDAPWSKSSDEANVEGGAHPDPEDLNAAELREYLTLNKVEFPKAAPASRLRKLATDFQKEKAGF